jgi:hypothetical protein
LAWLIASAARKAKAAIVECVDPADIHDEEEQRHLLQ